MSFPDLFRQFGMSAAEWLRHSQDIPEPQVPRDSIPPASKRILCKLPEVVVTKEDLDEDLTNLECAICLAEQKIGRIATKLPCGHIFCTECLRPWLQKSCSCPVCRYELETDDPQYEVIRKKKMLNHKLRYRTSELHALSVADLRRLLTNLNVSSSGCLEKSELIDRLEQSGRVVIVHAGSGAKIYSHQELTAMAPAQLRNLMTSLGVRCEAAVEKKDMIDAMKASGRITVTDSEDLSKLKISELKALMVTRGISSAGCVEKSDLLKALSQ